ncbi:hypothetical protein C8R44DRAFT_637636 [Mycena epipterygia]|nr:hypothetical protein C8R44DRAFT_637636 [Mycena epipterygia]
MRLTKLCLVLSLSLSYPSRAAQIPFQYSPTTHTKNPVGVDSIWDDLSEGPAGNATSHLIFDTVNSALQHWPNTRYRNGHNIIPGTVPVGTLLYHGRANGSLPTIPEWTSTDPEHSFPFCDGPRVNGTFTGCWQLTLVATRPLKVLYFDGSSAAKMRDGTLDTQDLLIWGKFDPARWWDERGRIDALCAWGKDLGIDGYVRMEMDFEIMICDFAAGVELVSADFLAAFWPRHVTPALWHPAAHARFDSAPDSDALNKEDDPELPPGLPLIQFEIVRAGSWHNRYPGETRIALDLSRLVSFYDTALTPSLIPHRAGKERWDHRVKDISATDLQAVTTRLRTMLASDTTDSGSGVDWQTVFRVVVDRYADRLELLDYLLNTTTAANVGQRAKTIQGQLRVMLTPYILFSAHPGARLSGDAWAGPVWRGCATRHTALIHASAVLKSRLTESERLLLSAVDATSREICRVVVRMWAVGVHVGLDALILLDGALEDESNSTSPDAATALRVVEKWRAEARALMAWLDWSVWIKCRPACGFEEICYLPTWPFFWHKEGGGDEEEWKRPQPRCIRQFEPYSPL